MCVPSRPWCLSRAGACIGLAASQAGPLYLSSSVVLCVWAAAGLICRCQPTSLAQSSIAPYLAEDRYKPCCFRVAQDAQGTHMRCSRMHILRTQNTSLRSLPHGSALASLHILQPLRVSAPAVGTQAMQAPTPSFRCRSAPASQPFATHMQQPADRCTDHRGHLNMSPSPVHVSYLLQAHVYCWGISHLPETSRSYLPDVKL